MFALVPVAVDLDRVGSDQSARALDQRHAPGLDQALHTLVQAPHHVVLVGVDRGHVDALEGRGDAELRALARVVGDLGGVEQRLGRDAPVVQAGAADLVLLDQRHGHAELRGSEQQAYPPLPPEDHDVEVVGHGSSREDRHGRIAAMSSPHLSTPRRRRTNGSGWQTSLIGHVGARSRRRVCGGSDAGAGAPRQPRPRGGRVDAAHLEDFARTRRGVEAYVEPPTTMTATTVVLVAHDGEWTRRRVRDADAAHELARKLGIPPTTPRSSGTRSACATGTDAGAAEVDARLRRGPVRMSTLRQVTQPSSFSYSPMSTTTGV